MEVCPLSRGANLEPLSAPLQSGLRFLHHPLPAPSSAYLTAHFPFPGKIRAYHVPLTYLSDGLGAVSPPVALHLRERSGEPLILSTCLFGSSLSAPLACRLSRRLPTVHFRSPYHPSSLPTALALAVTTSSHDSVAILSDEASLSPSLFIQTGRIPMAEHWVTACFIQL